MPTFLTGDELGNIKRLRYSAGDPTESKTLLDGTKRQRFGPVQSLAISASEGNKLLAAGYFNGVSIFSLNANDHLDVFHEWTVRNSGAQKCIGLAASGRGVYFCTNTSKLQLALLPTSDSPLLIQHATVPCRLLDWRLSSNEETFAYGGYEVDLSVWNIERAFTRADSFTKLQMTKSEELFPCEIYRAKNVPNDSLGLRQPIRITSLTYISPSPSAAQHHLLTGTQYGDVRRYDTRTARRPVAEWKGVGKTGGISTLQKGFTEHEAFVADHGGNLSALDLRNGQVAYGYKGIAGAVTSIAPSPSILASVSLDRFARIHSTFPLPLKAGQQQEQKGQVLERIFTTSVPTAIIWDQSDSVRTLADAEEQKDGDEDVWEGLENIENDSDVEENTTKIRQTKRRRII